MTMTLALALANRWVQRVWCTTDKGMTMALALALANRWVQRVWCTTDYEMAYVVTDSSDTYPPNPNPNPNTFMWSFT